jgi:superfamily II DNA or RNA helicase
MHLTDPNDPFRFIEFSGTTYQMQLIDKASGKPVWVFLQLDQRGELVDGFCDQEESDVEGFCSHLQEAVKRIYQGHDLPLHRRFENSFWNTICRLFADRLGDNPKRLSLNAPGEYLCKSSGGKVVFHIRGKNEQAIDYLSEIIEHRTVKTEENSLQFSNLSQEELLLWREGQPSAKLKYELSYWNDFAKWMMLLVDEGTKYKISFGYGSTELPNRLTITFDSLEMSFYLSAANLPEIIPSLATVESDLKIYHAPDEEIDSILFDKKSGLMTIVPHIGIVLDKQNNINEKRLANGISIDGWVFIPDDGFYPSDPNMLLKKQQMGGHELAQFLTEHTILAKKRLQGAQVHEGVLQLSYTLAFDNNWNLLIVAYLFSPGDLSNPDSRCFDDWVYLEDDGFYRIEKSELEAVETIVKANDVADFVTQNRTWLNLQEGFQVHLSSIQAQISYRLSPEGSLSFSRELSLEAEGSTKEFGPWIYIAGEGFYAKAIPLSGTVQYSDLVINRDQIPLFVRLNREDLQTIPKFFSTQCPADNVEIKIEIGANGDIELHPHYEVKEEYLDKEVRFFDDVSYVPGEGFYELPTETHFPEKYRHNTVIGVEDQDYFIAYELDALRPYADFLDPSLVKPQQIQLYLTPVDDPDTVSSGFLLKMKYETEIGSISATLVWTAIRAKRRFLLSEAGLLDLQDKRFNWLRWLRKNQIDKRKKTIQLSTIELIRLYAFDKVKIAPQSADSKTDTELMIDQLLDLKVPVAPNPEGLKSLLRPYQTLGLNWLWFLYYYRLSGLLCDDMGLGKTHQTMALIASIHNHLKESKTPARFLVVCPTSVIYHWQEKLTEFLPEISIYTFHGTERRLEDFVESHDLLLTSYGIYRNEIEKIKHIGFELAIFDEIQLAKNHSSRIYATLLEVSAKMRIGLTGTPIENRLRELKTLFDIVLPLYMPSEIDYKELFVKPIEREANKERQLLLSRMIKPFVMRRKKGDVLLDLPEKIEEISHCDLDIEQARLYNQVLITQRARIIHELEDESTQIPFLHIFALLSSLKQICNHPALYLKCTQDYRKYRSGKWDLFLELLDEARESNQKVVVYSQYLGMLDIIENYLEELGVAFAGIRGSTINRGEQLMRFKNDPSCEVFVASLQAAGLGVDLTSASVVIHYDRWWNAAREDQATDRVHRIGQTRGVQVFKLITKDTFEERIDQIISDKRKLMEEIVSVDEHDAIKQFTRSDLIQFLKETTIS